MARRYSRDNRGRFAPTGSGATARGGRLRTAAGNKRATVTTKSGMVAQGRMTGAPLKGTIGKTDKSRLNINLTRPSKPGQRGAYNEARTQIRANKAATGQVGKAKPAVQAKLGGRLNPAKKAFRAADKKFLNTIQKEKGISNAAVNARRDARSSSDFTKTPTTKGPKINNTISQTKEKRDIETKQRLFKQRITRAYNLPSTGTDIKGRRTAKIKAKAIATLQGTKRPDVSDSTVGGLRRARTSTGYRAPSSRLPTPSRAARAQSRAQTLAKTQRFDAVGRRLGNPTKMDKRARTGARAVDFNNNPKAFLRNTLAQNIKSRGPKGTAGFVAKPRSLTQAPKRIKKATTATPKPAAAKGARLGGTRRTTQAAAPKNTTPNKTGQSKTLNKFNSRPVGTMVAGKGINLVPSTKRVPLQVQRKESDLAFARTATKAARQRAAAPAKAAARQTAANRPARALANQKRTAQAIVAKGGKRPTPTRKQKKSLAIADAARTFYSANRVNSLPGFKVNTSKPGYRKPKPRS
jgi:hypothetical protein